MNPTPDAASERSERLKNLERMRDAYRRAGNEIAARRCETRIAELTAIPENPSTIGGSDLPC